jgi:glycerol-3-phosphate acyltransferase PlsX
MLSVNSVVSLRQEERLTSRDTPIRVAVDAMGGDYAPGEVVTGAVDAARRGGVHVALVGDPDVVEPELAKHDIDGLPVMAVPSEGIILEVDQPARALRQKPRASVLVSTGMVKEGMADACVTMGSTGAAMAAAAVVLGLMEGIVRPAGGGPVVGVAPHTVILDVGTNVDCRPAQLLSFAVIGDVFANQFYGVVRPRVALLSVGAEAGKGNRQVTETAALLEKSGLNFIGNVEANEIPQNKADVVVCDGFVGNVVMKLTEGLGDAMAGLVRERLKDKLPESDIEPLARELYEVNNVLETHGGGPLLGVNGVSVVGHGRGKAESVQRAIGTAMLAVEVRLVDKLAQELARVRERVRA